jgi:hypothetical protein
MRSLLWRCHGRFESIIGKSWSPIELVQDSEERIVIGFQNFEFPEDDSDLESLDKDFTNAALQSVLYPFYGSFHLPAWVRSLDIINGDIN